MTNQKGKKQLRERVFNFYVKQQQWCDKCYALAEDEEISEIYEDIENQTEKNTLFAKTSIVLLTANKYERNILHKRIYSSNSEKIKKTEIDLGTAGERYNKVYAYGFNWDDYTVLHIHANVTGSYTVGGSADIVRWVLSNQYLYPTVMVSFGICFGTMKSKTELGDVVLSKKIYPYFIGAKINGEDLNVVDDNVFDIHLDLFIRIKYLKENNTFNRLGFGVHFENYITGEAVVSSEKARDTFVNTTTQTIYAGDMEGYGLFKECKSGKNSVPCLVVKSICDWGAEKNFNENDERTLDEFKKALGTSSILGEHEKYLLKTLKDRLQAFSANCAFEILDVMVNNKIFKPAIIDRVKNWLDVHTGAATTCRTVRDTILDIIKDAKLGYSVSEAYVHRCILILEKDGVVQCEQSCILESNNKDECINPEKDASIYLIMEK